jgi:hypothetical protein
LPAARLVPGTSDKPWARAKFKHDVAGDRYLDDKGRQLPFVHWPGCEWPTMFRPEVFLRHRTLGMSAGERLAYVLNFYYRRLRANLKERMNKTPLLAGWVARREERLRRRRDETKVLN